MKEIIKFCKKEPVLSAACLLAVCSMFLVKPDTFYLSYIDFRTLAILFCLMAVMAGLQQLQVFRWIAEQLLEKVHNLREFMIVLVMLCFFSAMIITNDVALITFVPLTMTAVRMLHHENKKRWMLTIVVMQTIAANLGSMLTPIGNPQNLYLYGKTGMPLGKFVQLMLPYTAAAGFLLIAWIFWFCKEKKEMLSIEKIETIHLEFRQKTIWMYLCLFVLALLSVARIISFIPVFVITVVFIAAADYKTIKKIDYGLLLTFIAFFIFIGNMGRITLFQELLNNILAGNELLTAVIASQLISNVPAALLLSGFTSQWEALIIGTNLGGLGTLIASMASLISYKYVAIDAPEEKGSYFKQFTVANCLFLLILLGIYVII